MVNLFLSEWSSRIEVAQRGLYRTQATTYPEKSTSHRKCLKENLNMAAPHAVKQQPARKRVTFMITKELDDLLEVFCNSTQNQKNEVAQTAISEHLASRRKELEEAFEKAQA